MSTTPHEDMINEQLWNYRHNHNGESPKLMHANVGFKGRFMKEYPACMLKYDPQQQDLKHNEMQYAGTRIVCDLNTTISTLVIIESEQGNV